MVQYMYRDRKSRGRNAEACEHGTRTVRASRQLTVVNFMLTFLGVGWHGKRLVYADIKARQGRSDAGPTRTIPSVAGAPQLPVKMQRLADYL